MHMWRRGGRPEDRSSGRSGGRAGGRRGGRPVGRRVGLAVGRSGSLAVGQSEGRSGGQGVAKFRLIEEHMQNLGRRARTLQEQERQTPQQERTEELPQHEPPPQQTQRPAHKPTQHEFTSPDWGGRAGGEAVGWSGGRWGGRPVPFPWMWPRRGPRAFGPQESSLSRCAMRGCTDSRQSPCRELQLSSRLGARPQHPLRRDLEPNPSIGPPGKEWALGDPEHPPRRVELCR